jgi:hypothetical protein
VSRGADSLTCIPTASGEHAQWACGTCRFEALFQRVEAKQEFFWWTRPDGMCEGFRRRRVPNAVAV